MSDLVCKPNVTCILYSVRKINCLTQKDGCNEKYTKAPLQIVNLF